MSDPTIDERTPLIEQTEFGDDGDRPAETISPLPVEFYVLVFLTGIPPLVFELIFPFVNQMLVETGVTDDPEKVGYYSGVLESVFSLMALFTVGFWSHISDIIGRKPVILLSITGLSISTMFFGVSQTFIAMLVTRSIGGLVGHIYGPARTMTSELTDKTNQGVAFSYLAITYRAGQMLGLPLGGWLAHPERRFPIFQSPFWYKYPFSLPCFVAAGIGFFSVIVGQLALKETLRERGKKRAPSEGTATAVEKKLSILEALTPPVIAILASNFVMCLISESLFTLYPIFAFTPVKSGGLGLSEATIGTHLGIRALLTVPTMALYPRIEKRLGTLRFYNLVMSTFPFVVLCFPILNAFAATNAPSIVFNSLLFVYFLLWSFCGFAWTCLSVMINDVCPSPEALASMNALSQMSILLPQAVTPALATILYATSIRSDFLGGHGIWAGMFIAAWAAAFHSYTIRIPETNWRDIREEEEEES